MTVQILVGDVRVRLRQLRSESMHCVWTSIPYWGLRTYDTEPQVWGGIDDCHHVWDQPLDGDKRRGQRGTSSQFADRSVNDAQVMGRQAPKGCFCRSCGAWKGEHGLEPTLAMWIANEVVIWREIRRVLRKDGTAWLNCGDAYVGASNGKAAADYKADGSDDRTFRDKPFDTTSGTGLKNKQRMMMPARVALALQDDGWWIRDEIVWDKPNPMPSSVTDRTTPAHEMLYLLSKSPRYFFDNVAIMEPSSLLTHPRNSKNSGWKTPDGWDTTTGTGGHGSIHREGREKGKSATTPRKDGERWNQNGGRGFLPPRGTFHGSPKYSEAGDALAESSQRQTGKNEQSGDPRKAGFNERWDRKVAAPGLGIKNNTSMDSALAIMPTTRNKRSVWRIPTEPFPDAHFATAPTKLVEPCILASTSAKGCCPTCGAQWERASRKSYSNPGNRTTNGPRSIDRKHIDGGTAGYDQRLESFTTTLGWYMACGCYSTPPLPKYPDQKKDQSDDDYADLVAACDDWIRAMCAHVEKFTVVPARVLEPFMGSGTTPMVADRHGRDAFGVELNPLYATMAFKRIQGDATLLTQVTIDYGDRDPALKVGAK